MVCLNKFRDGKRPLGQPCHIATLSFASPKMDRTCVCCWTSKKKVVVPSFTNKCSKCLYFSRIIFDDSPTTIRKELQLPHQARSHLPQKLLVTGSVPSPEKRRDSSPGANADGRDYARRHRGYVKRTPRDTSRRHHPKETASSPHGSVVNPQPTPPTQCMRRNKFNSS